ncbi:GRAM domain-containing protein 4-like [Elysia marginata]|uniref:GRAM domain-containing protein 4-like n=1 Tax=Elysia marginata TaxID=1093978 RepID=A0AAV4G157_9GAST|nr:GRAM domain-containing protein 4-like [Elysia marginata]
MSSFRNLRSRFHNRGEHEGSKVGSSSPPAPSEEDAFDLVDSPEEIKLASPERDSERLYTRSKEDSTSVESTGGFSVEELMASATWNSEDEKKVFEEQLTQLQEQLMMVMIENQALQNEIGSSKDKIELERVKTELVYERHRCEVLQKDLDNKAKKKYHKVHRSNSDLVAGSHRLNVPGLNTNSSHKGSSSSLEEEQDDKTDNGVEISVPASPPSFFSSILHKCVRFVTDFLEDFTEEPQEQQETVSEDPLTVKKLKENIKRFGTEAKPYVNTARGIGGLLAWKSPPYTLIMFIVYMYSAWQGWLLPALLFCLSFRLFVNYLRYRTRSVYNFTVQQKQSSSNQGMVLLYLHRGWNVSFNFFETVEETKEAEDKELGVSDRLNLVVSVARRVQNFLGEVADSLEKVKSVLTWRHPEASRQLFLTLSSAFIASCILPTEQILYYAGILLGFKLFLIDYVYNRFPRVKRKYDSTYRLWQELPTDIQYEKRCVKSEIDKSTWSGDTHVDAKSEQVSTDDRSFCELFSLPESECPLPGWHGGRRCTLINREKSLTAAFKNGKLFLTHSFLCFERTKVPSPKNIVIPLTDIARLEKAKPYGWIPGGGMAIEIAVVGTEKPYIFGTILNRDEAYENIIAAGRKAGLTWSCQPLPALGHAGSGPPSPTLHHSSCHSSPAAD